jgi:hypothetical protein
MEGRGEMLRCPTSGLAFAAFHYDRPAIKQVMSAHKMMLRSKYGNHKLLQSAAIKAFGAITPLLYKI